MKIFKTLLLVLAAAILGSCGIIKEAAFKNDDYRLWSFGQELTFYSKYGVDFFLLGEEGSYIAVSPAWQARVLTSTYDSENGPSLGWVDRYLLAAKSKDLQTSQVGGEDRFWVGPQGGDFSIFFPNGTIQTEDNWKIPPMLASEPWKLVGKSRTQARLEKQAEFKNTKGVPFKIKAEREITVLNRKQISDILGIEIPTGVNAVAFQSFNKLTNLGDAQWTPDNGMLNISVQSCFNANRNVRVFIPYRPGEPAKLGDIVRDNYFESGLAEESRMFIAPEYIRFLADGRAISGIGVSPLRSEGIALSYDAANGILTVVIYIKPTGRRAYLANSWRRGGGQFSGDAISLYNNGPMARTSDSADRYYEISTYSPALNLNPGKSQFHLQRTFHFNGSEYDLGLIAYKLVGISIGELRGESAE